MFENLVDMSNPIDPYKGWRPMLAVSWKRVNDTTFQFKLRENVKFHNGEPFDAEAVKFSVDRLLGRVDKSFLPPTVAWHAYDTMNKAEPVDRHTVNIITKVPDPIILNRFNGFGMRMVSPKYYSENPTAFLQNNANGTGPYRLRELGQGRRPRDGGQPAVLGRRPGLREGHHPHGAGGLHSGLRAHVGAGRRHRRRPRRARRTWSTGQAGPGSSTSRATGSDGGG